MEPVVRYIAWSKDEIPDSIDLDLNLGDTFSSKEKAQEFINLDGDFGEYCVIKVTLEWQ